MISDSFYINAIYKDVMYIINSFDNKLQMIDMNTMQRKGVVDVTGFTSSLMEYADSLFVINNKLFKICGQDKKKGHVIQLDLLNYKVKDYDICDGEWIIGTYYETKVILLSVYSGKGYELDIISGEVKEIAFWDNNSNLVKYSLGKLNAVGTVRSHTYKNWWIVRKDGENCLYIININDYHIDKININMEIGNIELFACDNNGLYIVNEKNELWCIDKDICLYRDKDRTFKYKYGTIFLCENKIIIFPYYGEDIVVINLITKKSYIYINYPKNFKYGSKKFGKYYFYTEDNEFYYSNMACGNYFAKIDKKNGEINWIKPMSVSKEERIKMQEDIILSNEGEILSLDEFISFICKNNKRY